MPNVLILRAPGTNCDNETAFAFRQAGATKVDVLHLNRILESPKTMDAAQILCVPGGFSFGDDIAAGRVFATKIRNHLGDAFKKFKDAGKLILGICNGFQVLIKSGVLFDDDAEGSPATLTWNSTGMYMDRWVNLRTVGSNCVFLKDVESLHLPIAHAEGRFVPRNDQILDTLDKSGCLPLRYVADGNPNGSAFGVAGACDSTGRVFGLMPHPERHIDVCQHPQWTRRNPGDHPTAGDGFAIFRNAVTFFEG